MIITINEARDILGEEALGMSDDEVEQLISDLDVMAKYALDEAIKKRKEDAMLSAQLIYDIYKES